MTMTKPRTIYLDNAATTPTDEAVIENMCKVMRQVPGNPSSLYNLGRDATRVLEDARRRVAAALAVTPDEIIFTGSGTESDNLAVLGVADAYQERGKHIIVSAIEHKAVLAAAHRLEQHGFEVTYLPVSTYGLISVKACLEAVRPDTTLISVMYANNEIGTIEPIAELAEALKGQFPDEASRPLLHTDACQAVGYLPVQPRELGVDLMTINGAKIYGPKGTGALWVRAGIRLTPQIVGGDQERHMRAGTENVALASGLAVAVENAVRDTKSAAAKAAALRDHFISRLPEVSKDIYLNGSPTERLPNNVHITVPDIEGESLILHLNEAGICCSTGSACSAFDLNPSHVLRAIGTDDERIHGSLRFTLGKYTTKEDIDDTITALTNTVAVLRSMTAASYLPSKQLLKSS